MNLLTCRSWRSRLLNVEGPLGGNFFLANIEEPRSINRFTRSGNCSHEVLTRLGISGHVFLENHFLPTENVLRCYTIRIVEAVKLVIVVSMNSKALRAVLFCCGGQVSVFMYHSAVQYAICQVLLVVSEKVYIVCSLRKHFVCYACFL